MRTLLAQQFPFVFVDESQDTTEGVVKALKAVDQPMRAKFCLGFFGDPMQQIYATGIGEIAPEDGWQTIQKPENFRCATSVLTVANAIRRGGDALVQTRGRMKEIDLILQPVGGTARIFILPTAGNRDDYIRQVCAWVANANDDSEWRDDQGAVKMLVVVHRMAAKRLGFGELYAAMNDKAPGAFKDGFLDGSAWPMRPLIRFALPLSRAVKTGQEFEAMTLLREHCDLLRREALAQKNVPQVLRKLREASQQLEQLMRPEEKRTNRDVLLFIRDNELTTLDPRLLAYLEKRLPDAEEDAEPDAEDAEREVNAVEAFLACPAGQLWGYDHYVRDESPFSTHQGIKGAEFQRVLVVLDDEEGTHNQFSYEKYFGIKELSDRDLKNIQEGKETTVDRTRRLFYVCCTRALEDLVVVLFSHDAALAEQRVRAANIFADDAIYNQHALIANTVDEANG
jgi:DNA helicase-2/ATP-dependent DNA helicase PcrA